MFLLVKNIFKSYDEQLVLRDVNLSIEKGKFVSLLGQSGCGKTTLLRIIAGLEKPDGGAVLIDGKDVTNQPVQKRNTGFVFQNYALFPHLTVLGNVSYGLKLKKMAPKQIYTEAMGALHKVNLAEKAGQNVCSLSGGEQQRVAL